MSADVPLWPEPVPVQPEPVPHVATLPRAKHCRLCGEPGEIAAPTTAWCDAGRSCHEPVVENLAGRPSVPAMRPYDPSEGGLPGHV